MSNYREVEFNYSVHNANNRVYQNDELIFGKTNHQTVASQLKRMLSGKAPLDRFGKPTQLHHIGQKCHLRSGKLVEVTSRHSREYNRILHDPLKTKSSINRSKFRSWKRNYWRQRALDLLPKYKTYTRNDAELSRLTRKYTRPRYQNNSFKSFDPYPKPGGIDLQLTCDFDEIKFSKFRINKNSEIVFKQRNGKVLKFHSKLSRLEVQELAESVMSTKHSGVTISLEFCGSHYNRKLNGASAESNPKIVKLLEEGDKILGKLAFGRDFETGELYVRDPQIPRSYVNPYIEQTNMVEEFLEMPNNVSEVTRKFISSSSDFKKIHIHPTITSNPRMKMSVNQRSNTLEVTNSQLQITCRGVYIDWFDQVYYDENFEMDMCHRPFLQDWNTNYRQYTRSYHQVFEKIEEMSKIVGILRWMKEKRVPFIRDSSSITTPRSEIMSNEKIMIGNGEGNLSIGNGEGLKKHKKRLLALQYCLAQQENGSKRLYMLNGIAEEMNLISNDSSIMYYLFLLEATTDLSSRSMINLRISALFNIGVYMVRNENTQDRGTLLHLKNTFGSGYKLLQECAILGPTNEKMFEIYNFYAVQAKKGILGNEEDKITKNRYPISQFRELETLLGSERRAIEMVVLLGTPKYDNDIKSLFQTLEETVRNIRPRNEFLLGHLSLIRSRMAIQSSNNNVDEFAPEAVGYLLESLGYFHNKVLMKSKVYELLALVHMLLHFNYVRKSAEHIRRKSNKNLDDLHRERKLFKELECIFPKYSHEQLTDVFMDPKMALEWGNQAHYHHSMATKAEADLSWNELFLVYSSINLNNNEFYKSVLERVNVQKEEDGGCVIL